MGRTVRGDRGVAIPTINETPATAGVSPHRYRWDRGDDHEQPEQSYAEWHAAVAYKPGEVVYVDVSGVATLARVLYVFCERNRFDERQAKYRVQLATKRGTWAGSWVYTWPGFIQRGYALAGLAPDVPSDVTRRRA